MSQPPITTGMAASANQSGISQARAAAVSYASPELMPQGTQLSSSPRGAALLVAFTNPQQPLYGMGLTSRTLPGVEQLIPGQGPIDRGY